MPYYERKVTTTITVHMALLYGRLGKKGAHEKIVDSCKLLSTLLQKPCWKSTAQEQASMLVQNFEGRGFAIRQLPVSHVME